MALLDLAVAQRDSRLIRAHEQRSGRQY